MHLLTQAALVGGVGVLLGGAVLVVRGQPTLPPETTACAVPQVGGTSMIGPSLGYITCDEAKDLVGDGNTLFLDARDRDKCVQGHIANAMCLPEGELAIDTSAEETLRSRVMQKLRGVKVVVTYCDTDGQCAASTKLATRIAQLSVPNIERIRILAGGMPQWLELGYPAEAGQGLSP